MNDDELWFVAGRSASIAHIVPLQPRSLRPTRSSLCGRAYPYGKPAVWLEATTERHCVHCFAKWSKS